jgi:VWFA-related protein
MHMSRVIFAFLLAAALGIAVADGRAQQASSGVPIPDRAKAQQSTGAAQQQTPPQDQTKIIREVNLVDILFTVLDRHNRLVPDLDKDDFKIWDDKNPQSIRFFTKQSDLPLRIGLLMDTSNSIRGRLQFEQDALTSFIYSVIRRRKDQAFVMIFDDEPNIVQSFTDDTGKLRDQIIRTHAGGGTAIYDAVYSACEKQLSHPPRPPGDQPDIVRRVMVLISDGDDNLSTHSRAEAIEMAQRVSVVIYTISTSTQWIQLSQTDPEKAANRKTHLTEGDQVLKNLADETGGRAFFPYEVDDLDRAFQAIGDELRSQYSIAYIPSNDALDGKYHKIRLETPAHKDYEVHARRGYFAKPRLAIPDAPDTPTN